MSRYQTTTVWDRACMPPAATVACDDVAVRYVLTGCGLSTHIYACHMHGAGVRASHIITTSTLSTRGAGQPCAVGAGSGGDCGENRGCIGCRPSLPPLYTVPKEFGRTRRGRRRRAAPRHKGRPGERSLGPGKNKLLTRCITHGGLPGKPWQEGGGDGVARVASRRAGATHASCCPLTGAATSCCTQPRVTCSRAPC